jgi:hypothetical protein
MQQIFGDGGSMMEMVMKAVKEFNPLKSNPSDNGFI